MQSSQSPSMTLSAYSTGSTFVAKCEIARQLTWERVGYLRAMNLTRLSVDWQIGKLGGVHWLKSTHTYNHTREQPLVGTHMRTQKNLGCRE